MVARRIHVELVIGIAEQFGLSADEVGIILAHEGIRRSTVDPSTVEIGVEADVFGFGHDGAMHRKRRAKAWFPSTELAFLHMNFAFRISGEVETMRSGLTRHLRGFRPVQRLTLPETSHFQVTTAATGTELGAEATRTTDLRVQFNRRGPAYAVAGAELARFYLASLGLVAQQLLTVDYDFDGAVAKLVDPERTGRIDDLTFQIAPVSPLGDLGAAMQLAMILASPDLLQFWRELASNARRSLMEGGPGILDAPAPAGTKHVVAHTMKYTLGLPDRDVRALRVTRIEADMRPPPFATLIIHVPFDHDDHDEETVDDDGLADPEERRRRRLADTLRLNRNERPGRTYVKLAALGQSFLSAFPRFEDVRIQHVGGVRRPEDGRRPPKGRSDTIGEVSPLPPTASSELAALVAQPAAPGRRRPPVPADIRGRLLVDLPSRPMKRADVPVAELPYPLQLFAKAVQRANSGGFGIRDGGRFPLFDMDPEWGRFAVLRADRPRRAAIGWVQVEGCRVCAIELERRRADEALATGVFARTDGRTLGLAEAAAILRYACRRQEIDKGLTWRLWPPDGLYEDLRAVRMTHHSSRTHHIPMSQHLRDRAFLVTGSPNGSLAA